MPASPADRARRDDLAQVRVLDAGDHGRATRSRRHRGAHHGNPLLARQRRELARRAGHEEHALAAANAAFDHHLDVLAQTGSRSSAKASVKGSGPRPRVPEASPGHPSPRLPRLLPDQPCSIRTGLPLPAEAYAASTNASAPRRSCRACERLMTIIDGGHEIAHRGQPGPAIARRRRQGELRPRRGYEAGRVVAPQLAERLVQPDLERARGAPDGEPAAVATSRQDEGLLERRDAATREPHRDRGDVLHPQPRVAHPCGGRGQLDDRLVRHPPDRVEVVDAQPGQDAAARQLRVEQRVRQTAHVDIGGGEHRLHGDDPSQLARGHDPGPPPARRVSSGASTPSPAARRPLERPRSPGAARPRSGPRACRPAGGCPPPRAGRSQPGRPGSGAAPGRHRACSARSAHPGRSRTAGPGRPRPTHAGARGR